MNGVRGAELERGGAEGCRAGVRRLHDMDQEFQFALDLDQPIAPDSLQQPCRIGLVHVSVRALLAHQKVGQRLDEQGVPLRARGRRGVVPPKQVVSDVLRHQAPAAKDFAPKRQGHSRVNGCGSRRKGGRHRDHASVP